jgi:hypothetical protein
VVPAPLDRLLAAKHFVNGRSQRLGAVDDEQVLAICGASLVSETCEQPLDRGCILSHELEMLGRVYGNDAEARQQGLTPEQRLELHQQRSAPVTEELHRSLERQFAEWKTEPNSGLGKAITLLIAALAAANIVSAPVGRPLDNNIVERH